MGTHPSRRRVCNSSVDGAKPRLAEAAQVIVADLGVKHPDGRRSSKKHRRLHHPTQHARTNSSNRVDGKCRAWSLERMPVGFPARACAWVPPPGGDGEKDAEEDGRKPRALLWSWAGGVLKL